MPEKPSAPRLAVVHGGKYRPDRPRAREVAAVDLRRVFDVLPTPILLLSPDFVIVDMNAAYLASVGRHRDELIGRVVFDAFPDNPDDADADGVENLRASLERVVALREPDTMKLQRYDVDDSGMGRYEERHWSPINVPVLDRDGTVTLIVHRVVEVTALVHPNGDTSNLSPESVRARDELAQAELVVRADMLRSTIDGLRAAHALDEQRSQYLSSALETEAYVAATLQHAMLPRVRAPMKDVDVAARYLPADGGLEIGGDWFDIIELDPGLIGLVVGDVVGRGLGAAAVMGQLRSAMMTATIATPSPGRALRILDQFAESVEGAFCATAFAAVVDVANRRVTYSGAGHPPALITRRDGRTELLDSVRGIPLGIGDTSNRAEASAALSPGDTLVLYTDGLIERRRESLGVGIQRLADCVVSYRELASDDLATRILSQLGDVRSREDDTALVVFRIR
jgi:serine phosphatase RsbU (regulator of sigma subunit)